jgi:hypothetical protein
VKARRPYNHFPGAPASRRSRRDDAVESDSQAAALQARNIAAQEKRDAAIAAAKEAITQPAANDHQTEKSKMDKSNDQIQPAAPAAGSFSYEITPRAAHVGGGWRLQLFEGAFEVGGGVYSASGDVSSDDAYQDALSDADAWLVSRGEAAPASANNPSTVDGVRILKEGVTVVGKAVAMPGSGGGFTMCALDGSDVPVSAELYRATPAVHAPESASPESATDKAMQRACRELPEFYQVHVELENGCGCVVWHDKFGASHSIEGEGFLSDDIDQAIDDALEHSAKQVAQGEKGGAQ